VEGREIEEWEARRREGGDVGPVKRADGLLAWQKAMVERGEVSEEAVRRLNGLDDGKGSNGVRGTNGTNGVNGH
jgi:carotenoid cleavage dioxygenase